MKKLIDKLAIAIISTLLLYVIVANAQVVVRGPSVTTSASSGGLVRWTGSIFSSTNGIRTSDGLAITTYYGTATAGIGNVPVYGVVTNTGSTTDITTSNIQCGGATCGAGVYRISATSTTRAANTTETSPNMILTIGWTDRGGARTKGVYTLDTAVTGTVVQSITPVYTTGSLTYATALSGSLGNQNYDLDIVAERLN